ncbi:MAG TPA: hypothetical protein V6C89_05640 [Drouetiella sp.]|jgi:hypothetical protein
MTATIEKTKLHPAPDIGDILFLFIIMIPLMVRPTFLFADGSTGWHIVTGQYILQNHAVPHQDLFCYLDKIPGKADKAWVAYEWLSDTIMAALVQVGGLNLLAVVWSAAIGLIFLLLYNRCRKEGCHFLIVLFACLIGALVSAVHWLARPHLFTFFGVLFFSGALEDYYRRTISSTKLLLILSLYMLVWVNCHPAFVVGFVLIAIYLATSICSALYYAPGEKRKGYLETAKTLAIALVCTFVASLVNPNGIVLYQYIDKYLKGSMVLANTDEFLSPVFHFSLHPTCLEVLFGMFLVGLAISTRRLSFPRLLLCLAFAHLALSAVRNMPLFTIIVLPAIAQLYSKTRFTSSGEPVDDDAKLTATKPTAAGADVAASELTSGDNEQSSLWHKIVSKWKRLGDGIDDMEWQCKMHLLPIGCFLLLSVTAIMGGNLAGVPILESGFDPKDKPTKTLEYLKNAEEKGELKVTDGYNMDNWGGYIKYKLGTPVFIDDRADFYGEGYYAQYSIINQVLTFDNGAPNWLDWLERDHIQWVLTEKNSRLGQALKEQGDWKVAAEDPASLLLIHTRPYPHHATNSEQPKAPKLEQVEDSKSAQSESKASNTSVSEASDKSEFKAPNTSESKTPRASESTSPENEKTTK